MLTIAMPSLGQDAVPERLINSVESGKLIRDYMEWEFAWAADPAAKEPQEPADCGIAKSPKTWFLDGFNPRKPYLRECSVPEGTTIVFPITYVHTSLNANNPGECEEAIKSTQAELVSSIGELSVIVDGRELSPASYWRNETSECFPLKTELTQWTEKKNWELPIWGDAYVDGYWVALTFEQAGMHTVSLREQLNSSSSQQKNTPYTTYTINVGRNPSE